MERPFVMALVWFFCLGGLGIWFPFVSLYLHENAGLSGSQVGRVMAILPLMGILCQALWGQLGDRTGSRTRVLSLLAFGAGAGYALFGLADGFAQIALAMAGLALFSTALMPTAFSVTLALAAHPGDHSVGATRAVGTVGFLVAVVAFPWILDQWQASRPALAQASVSEPGLGIMFPLTGAVVALAGVVAFALPVRGRVSLRSQRGDWRGLLRHRPYRRVLGFGLLAFLFFQGPIVLFPVYVRSLGGTLEAVSGMWILMLALEIPLIALSGASLERIGARGLLAVGIFAGAVRWIVCGFADDLTWVWPVQILHGVTVAGLIVGGPLYVDQVVPERLRSTGQGVYAMVFSLGGISSNLIAGWLLERVGAWAPYAAGGLGALALGMALPLLLPAPERPVEPADPAEGAPAQESITRS